MPLRAYLNFLTLATMLPVVVFATIVGYFLVSEQRETFRRGAEERTLAVLTAVDNELRGSISTLNALATLPELDSGDLAAFRERARRILAAQPGWQNINLSLPNGQQLVNLQVAAGEPLPNIGDLDGSFDRLVQTGKPVVSDLAVGPVLQRWSFAVRVPVVREDRVQYVLSAGVRPDSIYQVIQAQSLPPAWVGVIVDRHGRIVSRNVNPAGITGTPASESLREALARASSGWFRGATIEGTNVYTPYRRSEVSGWAFAMGIPAGEVDGAAWLAIVLLLTGLLAALTIAIGLARFVSRAISAPIAQLASATVAIGRGESAPPPEATNIEEIRSLARTVKESLETLRESDRHKDEFLAMLSHELRNPLAALSSAAHVLSIGDPAREESAQARAIIERQTRHMARLIGDLLDINRVALGKLDLQPERFDLAEAVKGVLSVRRASGHLANREVTLTAQAAWVNADRARVEQIADNLLENALKFTAPGAAVHVTVRADGGDAVLEVADRGPGLSAQERERIFDLYVQGGSAPRKSGLGIGLALVKRLAEIQGGSVSAETGPTGGGAVFTVRLPAAQAASGASPVVLPLPRRPRSVLIIEDNEDARQMLQAVLRRNGHQVRTAGDGRTGLELAASFRPEIVLIDIALPDMDGYEVARRLRAGDGGTRRIGLVAVTGFGQLKDRQRTQDAGFDAHLVKPVSPERVEQVIAGLSDAGRAMEGEPGPLLRDRASNS